MTKSSIRRRIASPRAIAVILLCTLLLVPWAAGATRAAKPGSENTGSARPFATPTVSRLLLGLKVMNYYPAHNGWNYMWTRWDTRSIATDFGRIAGLHANAVRLILQPGAFGYPAPRAAMLARLAQVIALAHTHGLRVQLSLFDWWGQYGDIAGSKEWARAVLAPYSHDRRVAFVELQNEMDFANPAAMTWARAMIPYLRAVTGIPVTVSVISRLDKLQGLVGALRAAPPDFYTFHYYPGSDVGDTYALLQHVQRIVAPAPLFVGETGLTTAPNDAAIAGLLPAPAAVEAYQDHYYRTVDYATSALRLPTAAPWILNDFAPGAIPRGNTAIGREYGMGLYRLDGTPKPAARSTAVFFGKGRVDLSFDNGFESGFTYDGTRYPTEWLLLHASEAQFAQDTTVARSGTASARMSHSTGDPSGVPAYAISPIDANVVPGRRYNLGVWAKGAAATGQTWVEIAWFDEARRLLGTSKSAFLPAGTTPWTLLSVSDVAPPSAAYVYLKLESGHNSGTVWFDDVSFGL